MKKVKSNMDSLIGEITTVDEEIDPDAGTGYVKVYADNWKAVATTKIPIGTKVRILSVDGNKVRVEKA